jgi:hypothetical protein
MWPLFRDPGCGACRSSGVARPLGDGKLCRTACSLCRHFHSGFAESEDRGAQERILAIAREGGVRILDRTVRVW